MKCTSSTQLVAAPWRIRRAIVYTEQFPEIAKERTSRLSYKWEEKDDFTFVLSLISLILPLSNKIFTDSLHPCTQAICSVFLPVYNVQIKYIQSTLSLLLGSASCCNKYSIIAKWFLYAAWPRAFPPF